MNAVLTPLARKILDAIQQDFPLCHDPYAEVGRLAGCSREEAHRAVNELREEGIIRRIGGSFVPGRLGYVSALVAVKTDPAKIDEIAAFAGTFAEVTHNYEREGLYNLWFTIVAEGENRLQAIAESVKARDGVTALHVLPAVRTFKIKVDFRFADNAAND